MKNRSLFLLFILFYSNYLYSAEYPIRSIRMVVPFGPGTGSDVLGRVLAIKLGEQIGQPVVIDNRTGASGAVGTEIVARSSPDGYTLTLATNATMVTYPTLSQATTHYRADKDFTPISYFARTSMVMLTSTLPGTPVSIPELINDIKTKKISYASNGAGTIGHLVTEAFLLNINGKATHIPYKGSGQSHTDVLRGELLFMTDTPAASLANIRAGKFRALAITGDSRVEVLPNVPTFEELGIKNMSLYAWWGIFGPVGMSKEIINKLDSEVRKALQSPDFKTRLSSLNLDSFTMPQDQYNSFIAKEIEYWQSFLKKTGIKIEP